MTPRWPVTLGRGTVDGRAAEAWATLFWGGEAFGFGRSFWRRLVAGTRHWVQTRRAGAP